MKVLWEKTGSPNPIPPALVCLLHHLITLTLWIMTTISVIYRIICLISYSYKKMFKNNDFGCSFLSKSPIITVATPPAPIRTTRGQDDRNRRSKSPLSAPQPPPVILPPAKNKKHPKSRKAGEAHSSSLDILIELKSVF